MVRRRSPGTVWVHGSVPANMNLQLVAGSVRAVIVIGVGSLLVHAAGAPLSWLFGCVAAGLIAFGAVVAWAVKYGRVWNPDLAERA